MTEINEKYVVELLKKKGIRLYEEEITYVDPFPFEGEIEVGITKDATLFSRYVARSMNIYMRLKNDKII